MAKLDYNEELVNSAIEQLNQSKNTLSSNTGGLTSAIGIITGARGSQYIDASSLNLAISAADSSVSVIDEMIRGIKLLLNFLLGVTYCLLIIYRNYLTNKMIRCLYVISYFGYTKYSLG